MVANVSVQDKRVGMTDNELSRSLRFRALAAAQRHHERIQTEQEADRRQRAYWTARYLKDALAERLGVGVRLETIAFEHAGSVAFVEVEGIRFWIAENFPSTLRATLRCPGCDEAITTQVVSLTDLGLLMVAAGNHCDGTVA